MLSFTSLDGRRRGLMGVDGGRVFGVAPAIARQHRATPSRLAAAMERGSVRQTFLSAQNRRMESECAAGEGVALSFAFTARFMRCLRAQTGMSAPHWGGSREGRASACPVGAP